MYQGLNASASKKKKRPLDESAGHQALAWTHPLPLQGHAGEASPATTKPSLSVQEVDILRKIQNLLDSFVLVQF